MGKFLIIPADDRQTYTKNYLESVGYLCEVWNEEKACKEYTDQFDAVILPLPAFRDSENVNSIYEIPAGTLLKYMDKNMVLFGGMIPEEAANKFREKGIRVIDYYKYEETVVANAYATAQGVLKIVLNSTDVVLTENTILVTGYGKTGKAVANMLKDLNADVVVAVRKYRDIAHLNANGMHGIFYEEIPKYALTFDFVINTVPSLVLDEKMLKAFDKRVKLVEIASKPYGIDVEAAKELGLDILVAGSLPGKAVPKSAGKIIGKTIEHVIKEEKLWIQSEQDLQ